MFFGMIPVVELMALAKMQGSLIPDPDCAIPDDDGILSLLPATPSCLCPGLLAQWVWSTQMDDIAVVHRMSQVHNLSALFILVVGDSDIKDIADLDLFPAFISDRDDGAIHGHSHPLVFDFCSTGGLPPLR